MTSKSEAYICSSLRTILAPLAIGDAIEESELLRDIFRVLERWLPGVLEEYFPEWRWESFDGFAFPYLKTASRTGENEAELGGLCWLMSQALTPFLFRLRVVEATDELVYLHLRVGERVDGKLRGRPYDSWAKHLQRLDLGAIDWFYDLELGQ
jgi:hypothetical protein